VKLSTSSRGGERGGCRRIKNPRERTFLTSEVETNRAEHFAIADVEGDGDGVCSGEADAGSVGDGDFLRDKTQCQVRLRRAA